LKDILQKQGKFGGRTIYNWVQLQEPPKEEVLEFQPGQMFRREAQVVVISELLISGNGGGWGEGTKMIPS